jgi:hypothetical protein
MVRELLFQVRVSVARGAGKKLQSGFSVQRSAIGNQLAVSVRLIADR